MQRVLFLSDFNQNRNLKRNFSQNRKCETLQKSLWCKSHCSMRTEGHTGRGQWSFLLMALHKRLKKKKILDQFVARISGE